MDGFQPQQTSLQSESVELSQVLTQESVSRELGTETAQLAS